MPGGLPGQATQWRKGEGLRGLPLVTLATRTKYRCTTCAGKRETSRFSAHDGAPGAMVGISVVPISRR